MKFCILGIFVLAVLSCERRQYRFYGFNDIAQDSIYLDLHDYVLPTSEVTLWNAVKVCDKYYLAFCEEERFHRSESRDVLVEVSEFGHRSRFVPLPDMVSDISSVSSRNDTLFIQDRNNIWFAYDFKSRTWIQERHHVGPSYEDDDYIVQYEDHGEFGDAMWFIDKCSGNEYAFVGLSGQVCRLDGIFYVVSWTRIYEIPDPSAGFLCDSLTRYENTRDIHLLAAQFMSVSDYSVEDHHIPPIVHLDNESAGVENVFSYPVGGFGVSESAMADTTIIRSFIASDTLFCALHTPSGLALAKLNCGKLEPVHSFSLGIGRNNKQYRLYDDYPSWMGAQRYRVCDSPVEERLLIHVNRRKGLSELIDVSEYGNSFLSIKYGYGALN